MATRGRWSPEEVHGCAREKGITPSAGVEGQLSGGEMVRLTAVVEKMAEWLVKGSVGDAVYEMENAGLSAEDQIVVWDHFDSKQRSAMKKERARMKAAAKSLVAPSIAESHLPASLDPMVDIISTAAHK